VGTCHSHGDEPSSRLAGAYRLADWLPWACLIAPGVILNKDGSFQRTIRYRGPDLDSATEAELMSVMSRVNNVLKRFGSGWALFFDAERVPSSSYPRSQFPDAVSWLVDEERRASFEASSEGTFAWEDPPWRPLRAFDDGRKVYIQMPSGLPQGEAPPLFVAGADGRPALVNYRVRGTYYIVDRMFAAAELRLGANPQRIVRIVRTDARRVSETKSLRTTGGTS
jgi:hypothetical protein